MRLPSPCVATHGDRRRGRGHRHAGRAARAVPRAGRRRPTPRRRRPTRTASRCCREPAQGDEQATQRRPSRPSTPCRTPSTRGRGAADAGPGAARADPRADLTLLLRDLVRAQGRPGSRRRARSADGILDYGRRRQVTNDCGRASPVRPAPVLRPLGDPAHRTRPPLADTDGERVPNQVEAHPQGASTTCGTRIVTEGGYTRPAGRRRGRRGYRTAASTSTSGTSAAQGLYGYCTARAAAGTSTSPYVRQLLRARRRLQHGAVPDRTPRWRTCRSPRPTSSSTPSSSPTTPTRTAGSWRAPPTWVEDEIYDDVNDNRQYLRHSPLRQPAPTRWTAARTSTSTATGSGCAS